MTRTVSTGVKVRQITGLSRKDLASDKEVDFVRSLTAKTNDGKDTSGLSEKQVEWISDIWSRNFS